MPVAPWGDYLRVFHQKLSATVRYFPLEPEELGLSPIRRTNAQKPATLFVMMVDMIVVIVVAYGAMCVFTNLLAVISCFQVLRPRAKDDFESTENPGE
jgi:hypothetical protein